MGCYKCGSDNGTIAQMCPQCVEAAKSAHRQKHSRVRDYFDQQSNDTSSEDLVHKATSSLAVRFIVLTIFFLLCIATFSFIGPVKTKGIVPILLFSTVFTAVVVALLTYMWMWLRMLSLEESYMWGLVSLIFPGFVWRWAVVNWQESKSIYITHNLAIVVSGAAAFLLALQLHIPIWEIQDLVVNFNQKSTEYDSARARYAGPHDSGQGVWQESGED